MQTSANDPVTHPEPQLASAGCSDVNPVATTAALNERELELLALNLDAAMHVHSRPQFFSWTQGALQSLIRHELLICALRSGDAASFRVDSFSTALRDAGALSEAFQRDASLAATLANAWEEQRFAPVTGETNRSPLAGTAFARELDRVGACKVIAHGMHDVYGHLTSMFVFASRPERLGSRQEYFVRLAVPFLHMAWIRSQVNGDGKGYIPKPAAASILTARELEILRWIYLGKSNFEIGAILSISPLTVKNHVQKILRKLNVLNRTQAIGKALELRILNS
jgi:transcriptional regulator EpsA